MNRMSNYTLFEKFPPLLFSPLAAPGAVFYSEILLILFVETRKRPEPLSRGLCLNLILEVLEEQNALALTNDVNEEDVTEEDKLQRRAQAILRYLIHCHWLREEIQSDFTVVYTLPDYAFRLLSTLLDLAQDTNPPLQGMICAIHDLLQAAVRDGNVQTRVPQAYRETLRLQNGLKELQHNIGVHIETVIQQASTKDVLEQTFNSYLQEVTRRAYHELRTTDHVSRFRPGINAALFALQIQMHTIEAQEGTKQPTREISRQLSQQIQEIFTTFEGLDLQLQSIDIRHRQFFDIAIRSIESKLLSRTTTSGHLRTVLTTLLASTRSSSPEGEIHEDLSQSLITLCQLSFVESKSLRAPQRAREAFVVEPDESSILQEEDIQTAQAETLQRFRNTITRSQIRAWAQELLRDREEREAREIPLTGPDQLALLIYLKTYGDGSLGYTVEESPDLCMVTTHDIAFRNFLLRRTIDAS